MDKNPNCVFTPVLEDYCKHLDDLKVKYPYDDECPIPVTGSAASEVGTAVYTLILLLV